MASKFEKTNEPGIYKRGGRYWFSYRVRGKQKWKSARTMAEARKLKRGTQVDVDRGEHREVSPLTFGEYATTWVENYRGRTNRGFKESTRLGYRQALTNYAIPYFDKECGLRLGEIQTHDLKGFITWLSKQENDKKPGTLISVTTIRRAYGPVRAMLADAAEEGLIRSNPAYGVRVIGSVDNPSEVKRRALTVKQLRRFLGAVDPEWRLLFEFLVETGLRWGEVCELRWGRDIKFGKSPHVSVTLQWTGKVVDRPKSDNSIRKVPLSQSMARALWAIQGSEGDLVFKNGAGGYLHSSNLRRSVLKPAADAAGVPWVTAHTFRHTCASLLFSNGKDVKQVQLWLGHYDPGFTLRTYIHLMDDGVGDAALFDGLDLSPLTADDDDDDEMTAPAAAAG